MALLPAGAQVGDVATLVQDRTAIERVYYNHRLGNKPPFEQVSPPSLTERLVKDDLRKEAALKRVYHVEITPALLQAEVNRINTSTRAPDMLAEIKAALGNDPDRFANAFAKPILVERLLRDRFENDDTLHAARRREAERMRLRLLAARSEGGGPPQELAAGKSEVRSPKSEVLVSNLIAILKAGYSNEVSETTWQLGARPAETNAPDPDLIEVQKRFGPNAQLLSSPRNEEKDRKLYFEDLPADLQRVLRAQLRQVGDVSAVIETPGGFLLYVAEAKSDTALTVACLSLPKRSYEQWLEEQP